MNHCILAFLPKQHGSHQQERDWNETEMRGSTTLYTYARAAKREEGTLLKGKDTDVSEGQAREEKGGSAQEGMLTGSASGVSFGEKKAARTQQKHGHDLSCRLLGSRTSLISLLARGTGTTVPSGEQSGGLQVLGEHAHSSSCFSQAPTLSEL